MSTSKSKKINSSEMKFCRMLADRITKTRTENFGLENIITDWKSQLERMDRLR